MQIASNNVVSFHYQLQEVDGDYSEDSRGGDPMLYLHGYRGILPGLEDAMAGRSAGDQFSVILDARDAYGLRDDCLLYTSPSPRDRTRSRMPSSA